MKYIFYGVYWLYTKVLPEKALLMSPLDSTTSNLALITTLLIFSIVDSIRKISNQDSSYSMIFLLTVVILYWVIWELLTIYYKPRYKQMMTQMNNTTKFIKVLTIVITWSIWLFIFFYLFILQGTYKIYLLAELN